MVNIINLQFDYNEDFRNETEKKEDGFTVHAGAGEQLTYYLKPELTKEGHKQARMVTAKSPEELITLAKDKTWPGYFGSPRLQTADLGGKSWKGSVQHICKSCR